MPNKLINTLPPQAKQGLLLELSQLVKAKYGRQITGEINFTEADCQAFEAGTLAGSNPIREEMQKYVDDKNKQHTISPEQINNLLNRIM